MHGMVCMEHTCRAVPYRTFGPKVPRTYVRTRTYVHCTRTFYAHYPKGLKHWSVLLVHTVYLIVSLYLIFPLFTCFGCCL